jgi:hypothetical protein
MNETWIRNIGGMIVKVENSNTQRKPVHSHSVHQKSHMYWTAIKPGPQRWQASDQPPTPQHSPHLLLY